MIDSQLRSLTDTQLEKSIESVRARELTTLSEMLAHLREIDRRRLYSKRGFRSLHDYAIRKLRYAEDQAHRRVSAARLVRDLPEIESKIVDGSLKLTHLTDAQTFFRKVDHTKEEKLVILQKLENTTRAEARKVLQREEELARYSFEADKKLAEVIETLRGLHPHLNFDELMRKVCLLAHEKLDPTTAAAAVGAAGKTLANFRAARKISRKPDEDVPLATLDLRKNESSTNSLSDNPDAREKASRYIPTPVRRQVWINAQGKCQLCSSKFALEYDHILPFGLGGRSCAENLRLLCRNCNQRKAIESYGLAKMSKHLLPQQKAPSSS